MVLCERIGVHRRFCRDGNPPSFADDGLAERIERRAIPTGGILIFGPVGSHKTHFAAARTIEAARRGASARLLKWSKFCLEVRDTYKPHSIESERDVLNRYAGLDYLAIDDLGLGRADRAETDAALRLAYDLLDSRYEACLATDVTSNETPEELRVRFDERIARRIGEMCTPYPMLLEMKGPQ